MRYFTLFLICFIVVESSGADTRRTFENLQRGSLTQSPPTSEPPLTLGHAVKRAIANNHAIQQAQMCIEQTSEDRLATRSLLYPNLSLVANEGEYKNAVSSGNSSAAFNVSPYRQFNADLKFTQPLFAVGSLAALRVGDYTTLISKIDLELAERTLTSNVIQAFYSVLLNRRALEILQQLQKVVREALSTAEKRLHTGRGQLLDVLQVKTQIALLKPQIEEAHNQLESSAAQLATYMAEEGKYELQLTGELKGLELERVMPHMDFKNARLPEIERVKLQREQLEQNRFVVLGKHYPSVNLTGDYGLLANQHVSLGSSDSRDWSLIVALTIPIFSGLESVHERQSIADQDRQLMYQGQDLDNAVALSQVQSLKALQSTGASLVSAEEADDLARQSMREAERNYRLATIDFVQFLTVQQSALQAESSLNTIRYSNIVAFTNYFVATGQPLLALVEILEGRKP